jgi:hypothetical protein
MPRAFLLCAALAAPFAIAQSPLTTTFASSTFLAATTGVTVYFDLDVRAGVQINQMDVNFYGAAGPQVRIEIWVRNGTHVGNNTSNSGWTLAAVSNTVTSNGRNVATPMPLPTPFTLQPGLHGIAVQHFGAGAAYTAGTGVGNIYSSTAEMDFRQGGASNPPIFGGTQNAPRVMNCSIHYQPLGGFASATVYGAGCGGRSEFESYYENFPTRAFDLGGTAASPNTVMHLRTATGYVVMPGSGTWFTPVSAPLALAGNSVSPAQALGFAFPMPGGGTANDLFVCDDGYLWLGATGIADFTPAVNELLTQGVRLAPCWMSLNPAIGSIHFDVDPSNNAAYVTWLNVGETGSTATISMQVALFGNGDFEYRYADETISTVGNTFALVGMSPGGGRMDPGNRDLSASLPLILGPDQVTPDLAFAAAARPVLGTTFALTTTNIPATASFGATLFGFTQFPTGLDLTSLGMPGCRQYTSIDASVFFLAAGGTASTLFAVPSSPAFVGVQVATQSAVFAPGSNALGVITGNGVELRLDVQ